MEVKKCVASQLDYYSSLIEDAPDVETAIDLLDGYDLILVSSVVDKKFGKGECAKVLGIAKEDNYED